MKCPECGSDMEWQGSLSRGAMVCQRCAGEEVKGERFVLLSDKRADKWTLICPFCNFASSIKSYRQLPVRKPYTCPICSLEGVLEVT